MSVTAVARVRGRRARVRDQAVGRAGPRARRHRRPCAGRRRRRVHDQPRRRRAGAGQPHPPRRRRAAAVVLNSGNANAATGEAGRATRGACASSPPTRSGARPRDVLVCSTGLIGIPMPMAPVESGHPEARGRARAPTPTAGPRRPTRCSPPTPCARRPCAAPSWRTASSPPSAAWRRARRCSRPRWPRCSRCSPPMPRSTRARCARCCTRAVADSFNAPHRRRLHEHQRHRARARQRRAPGNRADHPRRAAPTSAFGEALTAVCDDLARQMAADAEGATKLATSWCGARARRPRRARGRARSRAASSCSARSTATTRTGDACSRSSARAARASIPSASTSRTTASPCAATASPRRTTRPRSPRSMAERDIEIVCDLHAGNGEATVRFTDLTHAYVDENMGTS